MTIRLVVTDPISFLLTRPLRVVTPVKAITQHRVKTLTCQHWQCCDQSCSWNKYSVSAGFRRVAKNETSLFYFTAERLLFHFKRNRSFTSEWINLHFSFRGADQQITSKGTVHYFTSSGIDHYFSSDGTDQCFTSSGDVIMRQITILHKNEYIIIWLQKG